MKSVHSPTNFFMQFFFISFPSFTLLTRKHPKKKPFLDLYKYVLPSVVRLNKINEIVSIMKDISGERLGPIFLECILHQKSFISGQYVNRFNWWKHFDWFGIAKSIKMLSSIKTIDQFYCLWYYSSLSFSPESHVQCCSGIRKSFLFFTL